VSSGFKSPLELIYWNQRNPAVRSTQVPFPVPFETPEQMQIAILHLLRDLALVSEAAPTLAPLAEYYSLLVMHAATAKVSPMTTLELDCRAHASACNNNMVSVYTQTNSLASELANCLTMWLTELQSADTEPCPNCGCEVSHQGSCRTPARHRLPAKEPCAQFHLPGHRCNRTRCRYSHLCPVCNTTHSYSTCNRRRVENQGRFAGAPYPLRNQDQRAELRAEPRAEQQRAEPAGHRRANNNNNNRSNRAGGGYGPVRNNNP
jgi:hypothetical protein